MIIEIKKSVELSRYDLNHPPSNWDAKEHSKNTEYANMLGRGPKNIAGFYFLYDNILTTEAVAHKACTNKSQNRYFITTTKTNKDLRILDFSTSKCLHDMLDILDSLNINIYTSKMIINDFKNISISSLHNHHRYTRILNSYPELLEVSWFGQLLTDYQNGEIFKYLIDRELLFIDGYRWCENYNPHGLTYCLFNSSKIDSPTLSQKNIIKF